MPPPFPPPPAPCIPKGTMCNKNTQQRARLVHDLFSPLRALAAALRKETVSAEHSWPNSAAFLCATLGCTGWGQTAPQGGPNACPSCSLQL